MYVRRDDGCNDVTLIGEKSVFLDYVRTCLSACKRNLLLLLFDEFRGPGLRYFELEVDV